MPLVHTNPLGNCNGTTNTVQLRTCLRAGFKSRFPGKPYPPWLPMLDGLDMDFAAAVIDTDDNTLNLLTISDVQVIVQDAYNRQPVLLDRMLRRVMRQQYEGR